MKIKPCILLITLSFLSPHVEQSLNTSNPDINAIQTAGPNHAKYRVEVIHTEKRKNTKIDYSQMQADSLFGLYITNPYGQSDQEKLLFLVLNKLIAYSKPERTHIIQLLARQFYTSGLFEPLNIMLKYKLIPSEMFMFYISMPNKSIRKAKIPAIPPSAEDNMGVIGMEAVCQESTNQESSVQTLFEQPVLIQMDSISHQS